MPTRILHGDDDRIVPIGASAMLSSKLVKDATLKVYKGSPHGMKASRRAELLLHGGASGSRISKPTKS